MSSPTSTAGACRPSRCVDSARRHLTNYCLGGPGGGPLWALEATCLPRIFEPFVQDRQAITFNGISLGLGLTVVRELVEAHAGHVHASSAGAGLGSRFVVTLPITAAPGSIGGPSRPAS